MTLHRRALGRKRVAGWGLVRRPQLSLAVVMIVAILASGVGIYVVIRSQAAVVVTGPVVDFNRGKLVVSANKRFLQQADGTPFFYQGDTAWELFHRLNREEADTFLENRRAKGYNVIQAVALAELGGTTVGNPYGYLPLINRDPTRPDVRSGVSNDYWDHVDYIVQKAQEKGMYIGMLPTWGDKVDKKWGIDGEPIFNSSNAKVFGKFIAERYKNYPNIIWILGGDRGPDNGYNNDVARQMAAGIRETGDSHLITFHPLGGHSSSEAFNNDTNFDFNMMQTGHCDSYEVVTGRISTDYNKTPVKPTIDGEPHYEDHPKCHNTANGWWDASDARHIAWFQVFTGAFGHTYGNHNIWQFWQPGRTPLTAARTLWRTAMDQEGAGQMVYLRKLIESRPFLSRVPDQGVASGGSGEGLIRSTRASDGSYALVYSGTGQTFTANMTKLTGTTIKAWWYNPRTGAIDSSWSFARPNGTMSFDPPGGTGHTSDWVLVLDDASKGFGTPGGAADTTSPAPASPSATPATPTATPATPTPTPAGSGSVNNTAFIYSGAWQASSNSESYQGDDQYSRTAGSGYSLTFTGTQAKIYTTKAPHHGIFAVTIDNGSETSVDLYSGTRSAQQLVYSSPVLTAGTHTLSVRVTSTKNAAASDTVVVADRIDVTAASATATPTPAAAAGDVNVDGKVNAVDLSLLLGKWGQSHAAADFNRDGIVGVADLSLLLGKWTG